MSRRTITFNTSFTLRTTALAVGLLAVAESGAQSYVFNPRVLEHEAVLGAKYRLSQGNFDQALWVGPAGTTAVTTPAGRKNTFVSHQLGKNDALSGRTYQFTLENHAGQGLVFSLNYDDATHHNSVLAWGNGFPASLLSADKSLNVPALNYGQATHGPADQAYNALFIEARADRTGARMEWSGLTFEAPGLGHHGGTLSTDGVALPPAIGTLTGARTQWIVADMDLSQVNWKLTGYIHGSRDAFASGDETVRFGVTGCQAMLPEPEEYTLYAGLSLVAVAFYRSRRMVLR